MDMTSVPILTCHVKIFTGQGDITPEKPDNINTCSTVTAAKSMKVLEFMQTTTISGRKTKKN